MTAPFALRVTPRCERLIRKMQHQHAEFLDVFRSAITILETDPYNQSQQYPIKKLRDAPAGEGDWRLRVGRWRFRYNIAGTDVELTFCGLRREDTYR